MEKMRSSAFHRCALRVMSMHNCLFGIGVYTLNHRLDIFWDRVENSFLSMWQGDKNEDFRPRIPNSPFIRENEKERIIDLMESGQGKLHTCVQSRIPNNLEMQPFLPPGSIWKSKGKSGYTAKIRISVLGMVEQNPEGRWQWVSVEKLRLAIPGPMISVLGEWIEIDGWIRLSGERLTRKKKKILGIQREGIREDIRRSSGRNKVGY